MSKIVMTEQSSAPDTPGAGKVAIYVDTNGSLCWRKDDGTIAKIASAGTYSLTIPATGTAALLDVAQTFSAAQTFSNVLTAPGMKPASDSTTAVQIQNAAGTAVLTVDTTNSRVLATALGVGSSSNILSQYASGVVRQTINSVSLNNDAAMAVSSIVSGIVFINNVTSGAIGIFYVIGGAGTLVAGSSALFSGTKDTASKLNCYAESGSIWVQNKIGSARNVSVLVIF